MKKIIKTFTLSLLLLQSCNINNFADKGYLSTSVLLPQKSFSLKVIPDQTDKISVNVSGAGLENDLKFDLTANNSKKTLNDVPIGEKLIVAKAFDEDGNLLAEGKVNKNVLANQLNTAVIELEEAVDDPCLKDNKLEIKQDIEDLPSEKIIDDENLNNNLENIYLDDPCQEEPLFEIPQCEDDDDECFDELQDELEKEIEACEGDAKCILETRRYFASCEDDDCSVIDEIDDCLDSESCDIIVDPEKALDKIKEECGDNEDCQDLINDIQEECGGDAECTITITDEFGEEDENRVEIDFFNFDNDSPLVDNIKVSGIEVTVKNGDKSEKVISISDDIQD